MASEGDRCRTDLRVVLDVVVAPVELDEDIERQHLARGHVEHQVGRVHAHAIVGEILGLLIGRQAIDLLELAELEAGFDDRAVADARGETEGPRRPIGVRDETDRASAPRCRISEITLGGGWAFMRSCS